MTVGLTAVVLALEVGLSAAASWPLTPEAERLLASDFVLPDLSGGRWRLYEARGRPVLLNFAATWCPPCRDELPALVRLYEREGPDGIQVVAIFIDRAGRADVAPFAAELALPFPVLLDPQGAVRRVYQVRALPTTILIDSRGRVAGRLVGALDWDTPAVQTLLENLTSSPPSAD
ncbi:MAG: TlpA disulfide reductase family protein [Nitrospinota bacterium]